MANSVKDITTNDQLKYAVRQWVSEKEGRAVFMLSMEPTDDDDLIRIRTFVDGDEKVLAEGFIRVMEEDDHMLTKIAKRLIPGEKGGEDA